MIQTVLLAIGVAALVWQALKPRTHIAKIEITVSGNDEPNRVAALVVDKINKLSQHRRGS